jgi:hypothetical protein
MRLRHCAPTAAMLLVLPFTLTACGDDDDAAAPAEPQETIEEDEAEEAEEAEAPEEEAAEPEPTDVFSLEVGDCFNDPEGTELGAEGINQLREVPVVDCEEPHDNEVYASLEQDDSEYPGNEEIQGLAIDGCLAEFEGYVGVTIEESDLVAYPITPTAEAWEQGNREVLCVLTSQEQKTGSAQGSEQ